MTKEMELFPRDEPEVVPVSAQTVVAAAMNVHGLPVPRSYRARLGRSAKALLEDGFNYELVVVAVVTAIVRGAPGQVDDIANDLLLLQNGRRIMSRKEYERHLQEQSLLLERRSL